MEQTEIDNFMVHELDRTKNEWGWRKQKLGANAILAVSLSVCKAGALHIANLAGNKQPVLPVRAFNVINGGSHAGHKLATQEFMILPIVASSFREAMKMGVEVYYKLSFSLRLVPYLAIIPDKAVFSYDCVCVTHVHMYMVVSSYCFKQVEAHNYLD